MATLAEMRTKVRDRADIVGEEKRYPDSELDIYINDSYAELYALLVRKSLIRPEATQTITIDGSATYAIDAAHYATLYVFRNEGGDYWPRLRRHDSDKRPFGLNSEVTGDAYSYRIAEVASAKAIEFYPKPLAGTYYVTYIPRPSTLSNDSDSFDDVLGWDEYIVVDAAIKALRKEGSDTTVLLEDKGMLMARIEDEAIDQEMGEVAKVRDVRKAYQFLDPADYWWYEAEY